MIGKATVKLNKGATRIQSIPVWEMYTLEKLTSKVLKQESI